MKHRGYSLSTIDCYYRNVRHRGYSLSPMDFSNSTPASTALVWTLEPYVPSIGTGQPVCHQSSPLDIPLHRTRRHFGELISIKLDYWVKHEAYWSPNTRQQVHIELVGQARIIVELGSFLGFFTSLPADCCITEQDLYYISLSFILTLGLFAASCSFLVVSCSTQHATQNICRSTTTDA